MSVSEVSQKVEKYFPKVSEMMEEMGKVVVGQKNMLQKLFMGILCDGHILVEGVPGLAKTTAVKALSQCLDMSFGRIQFTPDLLPADLLGTQIFSPKDGKFEIKKGPIFAHIILADEINRAPAKVQSALLEAMQEKQVTIGEHTFALPSPFLVMATQNPIEQEGTYPLPEAQVDRFMLKVKIDYPNKAEEIEIMRRFTAKADKGEFPVLKKLATPEKVHEWKDVISEIFVDDKLYQYAADLVFATRYPQLANMPEFSSLIEVGCSPRASINLIKVAKAKAFFQGRAYVTPQDMKDIGADVMRHRIALSYEAEAQDMTSDDIIAKIFERVAVP